MPFIVPLRYPRTQHIRLTERTKHGIEQEAGQAAARDGESAEPTALHRQERPDRRRGEAGIGDDGRRRRPPTSSPARSARRWCRSSATGSCCTARAHATTSSTSASYASDGGRIPRARIWLWPRHRYRVGATTIFSARAGHFFNDSVIVISGSSRETSNVASPVLLHVPWSVDSPDEAGDLGHHVIAARTAELQILQRV